MRAGSARSFQLAVVESSPHAHESECPQQAHVAGVPVMTTASARPRQRQATLFAPGHRHMCGQFVEAALVHSVQVQSTHELEQQFEECCKLLVEPGLSDAFVCVCVIVWSMMTEAFAGKLCWL